MKQPWDVLPPDFLEKTILAFGQEKAHKIFVSFSHKNPSTFRANTLKISAERLLESLKELKIEVEQLPWYSDAFILKNVPQKVLTETDMYKQGYLYVQSLSSMIPPLVLSPQPGEKILDLTAAPGSKTTQIAALMQNSGEILANDKSRIRMYKLEANVRLQRATNVKFSYIPGEFLWKKYPEYFDKTLVDVPCSMEGRFFVDDPKTYQDWKWGKVKMLSEMQKWLLRSAISATKPGGTIVYSTCTINPEENEGVIDWILKKEKGHVELEKIDIPHLSTENGMTQFGNKKYDASVTHSLRIFPSDIMEGFFVAKLKKLASNLPDTF